MRNRPPRNDRHAARRICADCSAATRCRSRGRRSSTLPASIRRVEHEILAGVRESELSGRIDDCANIRTPAPAFAAPQRDFCNGHLPARGFAASLEINRRGETDLVRRGLRHHRCHPQEKSQLHFHLTIYNRNSAPGTIRMQCERRLKRCAKNTRACVGTHRASRIALGCV